MVLSESGSFAVSSLLAVLTFSAMQVYKSVFAASQLMTILGGFTGSIFFVFVLTAVGNLEKVVFGSSFQTQLKEVVFCLLLSMGAASTVHRVCATTCLLFSLLMIYAINAISNDVYAAAPVTAQQKKKKN